MERMPLAAAFGESMNRLRRWWRSAPAKLMGTHIAEKEMPTILGAGATFEPAEKIAAFYLANRDRPTVVKRLIQDQPDYGEAK